LGDVAFDADLATSVLWDLGLGRSPSYGRFAGLHLVQRGEVERAARAGDRHLNFYETRDNL
jgi:hypothetical protein